MYAYICVCTVYMCLISVSVAIFITNVNGCLIPSFILYKTPVGDTWYSAAFLFFFSFLCICEYDETEFTQAANC